MRVNHIMHPLSGFPVYSIGFPEDDKVVLGGGGGAGRSGIKNKLRLYNIDSKTLDLLDELELDPNEDAPMTMAVNRSTSEFVCGINSSLEKRKAGDNQNCRVYSLKDNKIGKKQTTSTLTILDEDADDYQKVTAFSPAKDALAVGSTNSQVAFLSYPSLKPLSSSFSLPKEGGEIFDVDFYNNSAVVCGSKAIYFVTLPAGSQTTDKSKNEGSSTKEASGGALTISNTITVPNLSGLANGTTSTFRSARVVGKNDASVALFTVVNTIPPRSARGGSRKAFVCVYNEVKGAEGKTEWQLGKTRSASNKAVTVFDVNATGTLLAYGSSDLSVGILDAKTLAPLVSILNAHEFPPTVLRFNPSSTLLVSGSADNSVRIVEVPSGLGASSGVMTVVYVLLALLVLLAGVLLQRSFT